MSSALAATPSTGLVEAISFLTRPLAVAHPALTLNSLQQILLSTLTSVPTWLRNSRLTLTFSSAAPPRPIFAACIATNLDWSEWFYALGGREFDLTVERTFVAVQITGIPDRVIVWKQGPALRPSFIPASPVIESEPKVQVPISKFSQSVQLNKIPSPISIDSALTLTQSKTLAQQLLQSEHEEEEADEIFAMISNLNACLVSPTPTRECFNVPKAPASKAQYTRLATLEEEIFHSRSSFRQTILTEDRNIPSPVSSPDSSRPSSPSSTFSYSSQESLTSVSAASSHTASPVDVALKSFALPTKREASGPRRDHIPPVVDNTKKQVQRYLYQGGQSTVLTGGVMLGSASKPSPSTSSPAVQKYRAPVGGRKAPVFGRTKPQTQAGPGSGPWRRATASRV